MQCFLDKERTCDRDCMAHVGGNEDQCTFIAAADTAIVMGHAATRAATKKVVKHPESAPPPEVNT